MAGYPADFQSLTLEVEPQIFTKTISFISAVSSQILLSKCGSWVPRTATEVLTMEENKMLNKNTEVKKQKKQKTWEDFQDCHFNFVVSQNEETEAPGAEVNARSGSTS